MTCLSSSIYRVFYKLNGCTHDLFTNGSKVINCINDTVIINLIQRCILTSTYIRHTPNMKKLDDTNMVVKEPGELL
jgi:hypothetical protein